ncbi:MAG: glucose-6-phosphate isomerase [Verrucomicrobiota bacterium]|nr:glucose-6-phosphate isomerase [Verrucomicrobiota bacterium]
MSWNRYQEQTLFISELGFALDWSRMNCPEGFWDKLAEPIAAAFKSMKELEAGAIANPDEGRMVGHYWLRAPELAPTKELTHEITTALIDLKAFTAKVHSGAIKGAAGKFENLLIIGIGGSALGPQFVSQALGCPKGDKLRVFFFDNTDPDGMDVVLQQLAGNLGKTLAVVISKSGGTPETRNGMLEAEAAWKAAGLSFAAHAVAVTGVGSKLDKAAQVGGWLARFPMWDWVGGRTSETASVGIFPAMLQGIDTDGLLAGAAAMDRATRVADARKNPAAILALMWFFATDGRGAKDMVILPYKDRLGLFAKYLQQLIMESIGKEFDLNGWQVNQGIAVYGNKGSTDQHAYIQQLREGVPNFFATFIEVLKDREGSSMTVEGSATSGDFLQAFFLGTRAALHEKGRGSLTITVNEVSPQTVGQLIALYERAVGFYASLVNVNAYHQPGVEAGKKAATTTLAVLEKVLAQLSANKGKAFTAEAIATAIGLEKETELVFKLLEHLAANPARGIVKTPGATVFTATYAAK